MKKQLLSLLCALPLVAQAQFSQTFDASTTTPAGWSIINGGDALTFAIGPSAANSAYSLPNSVYIQYSTEAHDDYLVTPQITVTPGVSDRLTFFAKNQDPNYVENYEVKLSTAGNTAADMTVVLKAEAPAPNGWTQYSIDLSAYAGQQVYVGFHAVSADKFRLLFDNIAVDTAPTVAPSCSALTSPANGSTVSSYNSATLQWAAPTSGGKVDSYDVYMDTNPNPTTLISSNYLTAFPSNLAENTTYYWKVVPKNAAGSASGCEVYSFKTGINPYAPYCGPLTYSSAVEAITSVTFGGMTNTSSATSTNPHELFTDKVATVQQGSSQSIVLGAYTGGNFTNRFIVFIDWNQNGVFTDAGETYFGGTTALTLANSTGTDGKTVTGTIAVPATAILGNTRMRIKKNYGTTAAPNPCFSGGTLASGATTGFGQAEDYTVTVTAATLGTVDDQAKKASVYPNPVKDILNISSDEKVVSAQIFSAEGRMVKEQKILDSKTLDMGALPKGVYVVKVKTVNSERTYKVIKE